jgi:hypothetical protein
MITSDANPLPKQGLPQLLGSVLRFVRSSADQGTRRELAFMLRRAADDLDAQRTLPDHHLGYSRARRS